MSIYALVFIQFLNNKKPPGGNRTAHKILLSG
uniref:Uncharacterized protein n=1 Tax=Siphoviridae sp. ctq1q8 TaxID=2826467 RepID=A0A8S5MFH8_9CAUD|nr:MAG TPA: hypothetical protein [Siphoviridae sp. ctq1q8]